MKTNLVISALVFTLFWSFSLQASEWKTRFEARKEINKEYRTCVKKVKWSFKNWKAHSKNKKACRKVKKTALKQMNLDIKGTFNFVRNEVNKLVQKTLANVDLNYLSDGEDKPYLRLAISTNLSMNEGVVHLGQDGELDSSINVTNDGGKSILGLNIYDEDMYNNTSYEDLRMPGDRDYPAFLGGAVHETLSGFRISKDGKSFDVYLDGSEAILGFYVPASFVGDAYDGINDFKNKIPILKFLPNIKIINLKVRGADGTVIGKTQLVGHDDNGANSGILLRMDYELFKEAAMNYQQ